MMRTEQPATVLAWHANGGPAGGRCDLRSGVSRHGLSGAGPGGACRDPGANNTISTGTFVVPVFQAHGIPVNIPAPAPGDAPGQSVAGHVFISYVHEDSDRVDHLQQTLQTAGITVWRDTADLWPGEDWRAMIRAAITGNALVFLACFSRNSLARGKSYQNEELTLAVEQLRLRSPEHPWLIPVRFNDCQIPERDIGGGRMLSSIQRADLFGDRYDEEARRLITAIRRILGQHSELTPTLDAPEDEHQQAPATGGQQTTPRTRSRWRAVFGNLWVIGGAILIAAALTALYPKVFAAVTHHASMITGVVTCESGRQVVDVWIAASSGQSASGYAHLGPPDISGISSPVGPTASFTYLLADGGSYAAHVGCGGTAQHWASKNYSPLLSQPNVRLRCYDPVREAPPGTTPTGTCKAATGS